MPEQGGPGPSSEVQPWGCPPGALASAGQRWGGKVPSSYSSAFQGLLFWGQNPDYLKREIMLTALRLVLRHYRACQTKLCVLCM